MKRPLIRICFTVFICLIYAIASAQQNYKKSTIITTTGDTLEGFINYREWSRNPREFAFKTSTSADKSVKYTTENLQSVVIDGYATYERFPVRISMNEVKFEKLTESASQPEVQDTVFLQLLAKGKHVNLYAYRDDVKARFYILENDSSVPVELSYRLALINGGVTKYPVYRQQLMKLSGKLNDSLKGTAPSLETVDYKEADLTRWIAAINGNSMSEIKVPVARSMSRRFYIAAGINFSTIDYAGVNLITSNGVDNEDNRLYVDRRTAKAMPSIAAGTDIYFNREIRRTYVKLDLSIAGFSSTVESKYKFNMFSAEELANTYTLSGVTFSLRPQLLFNVVNNQKVKVYIGGGPSLHYMLTLKNELYQKTNQTTPPYTDKQTDDFLAVKDLFANVVARAGVRLDNKLDLSFSTYNSVELTRYMDAKTSARLNGYQFSVGYSFPK